MTGPEHFKLGEQILADAKDAKPDADRADVELFLRFAEAHFAAAEAAATAEAARLDEPIMGDLPTPWGRVLFSDPGEDRS